MGREYLWGAVERVGYLGDGVFVIGERRILSNVRDREEERAPREGSLIAIEELGHLSRKTVDPRSAQGGTHRGRGSPVADAGRLDVRNLVNLLPGGRLCFCHRS